MAIQKNIYYISSSDCVDPRALRWDGTSLF